MTLKRLSIAFLIIAFFAPVTRPLASSGEGASGAVCRLSGKDCKHHTFCTLKDDAAKGHMMKEGRGHSAGHRCDTFFECGTNKENSSVTVAGAETPALLTSLDLHSVQLENSFIRNDELLFKETSPQPPERPPTVS